MTTTVAVSPHASPLADVEQIQGNILLPFRGSHQAFLFLSFASDRAGARRWLGDAAGRVSGTQATDAAREGSGLAPEQTLLNIGLTATGLVLLHGEVAADLAPHVAFWSGPLGARHDESGRTTTTAALLGDVGASDPRTWVIGGPRRRAVDALLTIAAEDEPALRAAVDREIASATEAGLTVVPVGDQPVQWGAVLRNAEGHRIEHFGFADGVSQPGIRGFTEPGATRPGSAEIAAGEFILGCPGERRPPARAARPPVAPWMRGGSFQVFRRLRQDPAGFWARMAALSSEAGHGGPEDAAARALGRRLDGTPLATVPDPAEPNLFDYRDDEAGAKTALFAHIRKMNPRSDEIFRDRTHKMLRRGIPYGPPFDRDAPDDADRGLIFNAYLACIEDQFEYLQRNWANDAEFPSGTVARYRGNARPSEVDGLDPILGDDEETAAKRLPADVVSQIPPAAFGGFVTTTGAVYAFAPSRPALLVLAGDEPM